MGTLDTRYDISEINKISTTKLSILDDIEVKSASFLNKSFPFHFHNVWSLGYIESGSEYISFNDADILMSHQTQVLIPPYSLHKNWGEKNSPWTYKAIYIKSNIVKKLAKQLNLDYAELANSPYFINRSKTQLEVSKNSILKTLTSLLKNIDLNKKKSGRKPQKSLYLDELLEYISIHYNSKVTLDSLEDEFKVNKFSLLRNFKNKIGISPLEYQMSIRIEKSKQLFFEDIPLTHIALDSGFFDQSHFTHNFKKYVGVTPGEFKSNCNILQDIEKLVL